MGFSPLPVPVMNMLIPDYTAFYFVFDGKSNYVEMF